MKQFYKILFLTLLFTSSRYVTYAQEVAIFNSTTSGTLSGVPFTMTFTGGSATGYSYDFSGSGFSAAPLSNSESTIDFNGTSDWTITFDSPIENLRVYAKYWRSLEGTFDQPFTILSGFNMTNPTGNAIQTTTFSDGIIEFSNPITTLNLTLLDGGSGGYQAMTFAIPQALSTDEFDISTNGIELFPNPTSDFIEINGLSGKSNYAIHNTLGQEVKRGVVQDNSKIDIRTLINGMYFLKIEDASSFKFIKE